MSEDENDVRAACQAHARAMQAMDLTALQSLWDRDFGHLAYQPEEYERACRTWDEIVAYWTYIPTVVERITQWREIESDVAILGDAALVYSVCATSFELKGSGEALQGDVRFTFGLRRTAGGWRFIHCHESRQLVVDG